MPNVTRPRSYSDFGLFGYDDLVKAESEASSTSDPVAEQQLARCKSSPTNTSSHDDEADSDCGPQAPPAEPGATGGSLELLGEGTDTESKKQRLARKAELARMSRWRKKKRMGDLEQEVAELKQELDRAHKHRRMAEKRLELLEAVKPVALPASPAEPVALNKQDVLARLLHSMDRRTAAAVQQVAALPAALRPDPAIQLLEAELPTGLLAAKLNLAPEQLAAVQPLNETLRQQAAARVVVEAAVQQLSAAVRNHVVLATTNMDKFIAALTKEQLVYFLSQSEQSTPAQP
jgi:hypothetical protein